MATAEYTCLKFLTHWHALTNDRSSVRNRKLLHAIEADPLSDIGKPERLRHYKDPAFYSRRIDQTHR
ncbi:type II toxin-antitoxin system YoeB family toxin [Rosenbergiella collisarenosi]|uniref:type II toxin-antitoxin system YoeB family toxin n=1 Tax=Rosenbergiella collisarenosi TaxID=1544695 RepID=UPI001BD921E0|nr:type II toxin-antitoxin system YoeB family toxin [Rosenbergiella collisarenosi]